MTAKHFTTLALSNGTKQVFQQQQKLNKKTEGTNNTKSYIWDGYDGHNCSMLCQVQLLPHFPPPLCFIHRPPQLCFILICALGHPWSFSLMYATTQNRTIFSTVKNLSRTSCFDSENPNTKNKKRQSQHVFCSFQCFH